MTLDKFQLSNKVKKKLKDKSKIKQELLSGKTAQEILEFTPEIMMEFSRGAHLLLEHDRLHDAADAYLFLVTLNPHKSEYWLGLGTALQKLRNYEDAVDAYEMASYCAIENPEPYFYLAKCLFALHEREATLQALEITIETAGDHEEWQDLKEQALKAKKLLEE